jgi:D-amino-acid dehydrogenase
MKHVMVIGGGVVGLTTAWSLLEAGLEVSLVERESELALGASRANGGQLSYRYVSPLADRGVPLKALRWLFEPDGPLRFKPEWNMHQWMWLASFLSNCRGSVNRLTTQRLLALGAFSQTAFRDLYSNAKLEGVSLRTPGKLVIYRQPREFADVADRLRAERGHVEQILDCQECLSVEPALADSPVRLAGGVFTTGEAVADCYALSLQLAQRMRAHSHFKGLVHAQAQGFEIRGGKAIALRTDRGDHGADAFVIAAGLQSRALALTAGIRLPIYPLKGYSLTAPIDPGHKPPEVSVTDIEKKILYARIDSGLRVAAMADLVGENTCIDPSRIASLYRSVRATFPRAARYEASQEWAGLRPATPSGAPILGATPVAGVWLNVGHGALGFTMSFGAARIVSALIAGQDSPLSLEGLQLPLAARSSWTPWFKRA